MPLEDASVERAVLAGIYQYNKDALIEIDDLVTESSFNIDENKVLYKCLVTALEDNLKIDLTSVMTTAERLGVYNYLFKDKKNITYIRAITNFPIELSNVRTYAKRLAKLEFARLAQRKHKEAYDQLNDITGSESFDKILSVSENAIFDLIQDIHRGKENQIQLVTEGAEELLQFLLDNPRTMVGLPTPWPCFNTCIGGGLRRGGINLVGARPKAQPYDAQVLTSDGFVTMGSLKIGDKICHPNGDLSTIVQLHEHGYKDIYRFTFDDNSYAEACADHLWKVKSRRHKNYSLLSWNQMSHTILKECGRFKWQMPMINETHFQDTLSNDDISPYMLGVLIGNDGCNSHTKFIPTKYIYSSIKNRYALLQGLFDTDGHIGKNGIVEYTTVSMQLKDDIIFILKSLGFKVTYQQRLTKCNNKTFYSYRIYIRGNNCSTLFSIPRKKTQAKLRTKPKIKRKLINVQYIGKKRCRCITIDNPDGLYVTNDFIVTHNCGKTSLAKEVAVHFASVLDVPVLVLDTEMSSNDLLFRSIASLSSIPISQIENGQFAKDKEAVFEATRKLHSTGKFYYINVAGKQFEEILSIIRRFVVKHVGYDENGNVNNCLVIYDYFKLMTPDTLEKMQEYQAMGFQMSRLSDFSKEYDFPCLAFVQINRDGITKETSDIIAQSDRLLWLAHSVSIYKEKNPEEIIDGNLGTHKLIVLASRYGGGMQVGQDYIHMKMKKDLGKISEVGLYSQTKQIQKQQEDGFDHEQVEETPFE